MLRTFTFLAAGAAVLATGLWAQEDTPDHRLRSAADVFHEVMAAPDKGIPRDLLEKAQCVIIVPGLKKAAFIVGGDYGKGYAVCRHDGGWTGPAAITLGGGSFGFQIGAESTDIIMLVMSHHGMEDLARDKFSIGADASAAAGPVGRTTNAATDASLHAEILSWSRAHGAFAGVSLNGTVVKKDGGENRKLYGMEVSNRAILHGQVPPPAVAGVLTSELDRFPKARS
ncbi:MAG: lipid-binding SYLF domain-containing protein [Bryobacteraceae bacterium]